MITHAKTREWIKSFFYFGDALIKMCVFNYVWLISAILLIKSDANKRKLIFSLLLLQFFESVSTFSYHGIQTKIEHNNIFDDKKVFTEVTKGKLWLII